MSHLPAPQAPSATLDPAVMAASVELARQTAALLQTSLYAMERLGMAAVDRAYRAGAAAAGPDTAPHAGDTLIHDTASSLFAHVEEIRNVLFTTSQSIFSTVYKELASGIAPNHMAVIAQCESILTAVRSIDEGLLKLRELGPRAVDDLAAPCTPAASDMSLAEKVLNRFRLLPGR